MIRSRTQFTALALRIRARVRSARRWFAKLLGRRVPIPGPTRVVCARGLVLAHRGLSPGLEQAILASGLADLASRGVCVSAIIEARRFGAKTGTRHLIHMEEET